MKKISEIEKNLDKYLNDNNLYGIVNVYDTSLDEMSRVGKIPNTSLEIHIEGGEGYLPHVHICKKDGKNIVLRLKILSNEYFREKDDKLNTLNSKERSALNEYIHGMYNIEYDISNWAHICMMWNQFNSSHEIKNIKAKEIPDYSTINEHGKDVV